MYLSAWANCPNKQPPISVAQHSAGLSCSHVNTGDRLCSARSFRSPASFQLVALLFSGPLVSSPFNQPVGQELGGACRAFSWGGSGISTSCSPIRWSARSHVVLPHCEGVWYMRASCEPRREPRFARLGEPGRVCAEASGRSRVWLRLWKVAGSGEGSAWAREESAQLVLGALEARGGGMGGRECQRS